MIIQDAIAAAKELTGGAVIDDSYMLRWLSELDGQIAYEFYQVDAWLPYTADDLTSELLLPYPWDSAVYLPYLESREYYARGEYDRYENARAVYMQQIDDFRKFVWRQARLCWCNKVMLKAMADSRVIILM